MSHNGWFIHVSELTVTPVINLGSQNLYYLHIDFPEKFSMLQEGISYVGFFCACDMEL